MAQPTPLPQPSPVQPAFPPSAYVPGESALIISITRATQATPPTVSALNGWASASLDAAATDTAGLITFTSGGTAPTNNTAVQFAFATPRPTTDYIIVGSLDTSTTTAAFQFSGLTTAGFDVVFNSEVTNLTVRVSYLVIG